MKFKSTKGFKSKPLQSLGEKLTMRKGILLAVETLAQCLVRMCERIFLAYPASLFIHAIVAFSLSMFINLLGTSPESCMNFGDLQSCKYITPVTPEELSEKAHKI